MAASDFFEISADQEYMESVPVGKGLWQNTPRDVANRQATINFRQTVLPCMLELIEEKCTAVQKETLKLYYVMGKTQEEIAIIRSVEQSTVSRCLHGTLRRGILVGGAVPKLKKLAAKHSVVSEALEDLQSRRQAEAA